MDAREFLRARLSDPVDVDGQLECWGAGEYAVCSDWSDLHEKLFPALLKIVDAPDTSESTLQALVEAMALD